MATTGITYELTEEDKKQAEMYVEESGFFKNRLADFLNCSRPTLDRLLKEDQDFFTRLKHADSLFCKKLVVNVSKKDPAFLLRLRYKEEFDDKNYNFISKQIEEKGVDTRLDTLPCVW